jgi:hypothetical protein
VIFLGAAAALERTSARNSDETESVQDVLNAWSAILSGPKPHALSADFSVLFAKMQADRMAKRTAENCRHHELLTEEQAAHQKRTKQEFMDTYQAFYGARSPR